MLIIINIIIIIRESWCHLKFKFSYKLIAFTGKFRMIEVVRLHKVSTTQSICIEMLDKTEKKDKFRSNY